MDYSSIVMCGLVDSPVSARSLVQRSTTECGVSECDRETSTMRIPWPMVGGGGVLRFEKGIFQMMFILLLEYFSMRLEFWQFPYLVQVSTI
jgi:hypothetical protein